MPLFATTPFQIIRPEARIDPMSKQMVQDPPWKKYAPRDESELYQMWKQQDPELINVPESHAEQVLRKQPAYQEIPVDKFQAAAVKKTVSRGRKTSSAK